MCVCVCVSQVAKWSSPGRNPFFAGEDHRGICAPLVPKATSQKALHTAAIAVAGRILVGRYSTLPHFKEVFTTTIVRSLVRRGDKRLADLTEEALRCFVAHCLTRDRRVESSVMDM